MELRQLEYFQVLAEELNLAKAAERCHITQQALSKSMRGLANEYGTELFYRDHGRLKKTDFGEFMYKEISNLLQEAHRTERILRSQSAQEKGQIRIACSIGVFMRELADYMKAYQNTHPQLDLKLIDLPDVFCEQYVWDEKCDLGFSIGLPEARNDFDCVLYKKNKLCAMVQKDHPLANKSTVCLADCAKYPVLLKNETYKSHEVFMQEADRQNVRLQCMDSRDGFLLSSVLDLNPEAVGIGTMYLQNDRMELVCVPFEEESLNWDIYIIVKKGHYMSAMGRRFLEDLYAFRAKHQFVF